MKTKPGSKSRRRTSAVLALALGLPLLAGACQQVASKPVHNHTKEAQMILLNHSLWQLVEQLNNSHPLTLEKAEKALGQPLIEQSERSNPFYNAYTGHPIALKDNLSIHNIDLRINIDPNRPFATVLVLYVEGACLGLQNIQKHYPALEITGAPTGRSENESTTHTSRQSWGQLHFGFQVKNPSCLAYVSFTGKGD